MNIGIVSESRTSSAKSQNAMIAAHLRKGARLTAMEALQKFGCFRLAARVLDLKTSGMDIRAEMIPTLGGARVAQYSIEKVGA